MDYNPTGYVTLLLEQHTRGRRDRDALWAALTEMATPGYPWSMFTAGGNAACSAALARLLQQVDTLEEGDLLPATGAAMVEVIHAGHREVGDTEPEVAFSDAANLIAVLRGWAPVSRFQLVEHYGHILDEGRRLAEEARAAALTRLVENNDAEFQTLLAEETEKRQPTP